MSDTGTASRVAVLLAGVQELVAELVGVELTCATSAELLDALHVVETLRRQLDFADYRVIREAEGRGLHGERGRPTMARLLQAELRLDAAEASARTRAATAAVGLRSMAGELAPPPFPHVAAAQAAGAVSQKQALIISGTFDKLPDEVQAEHGTDLEYELLDYATRFDAGQLSTIGKRLRYLYDQDGAAPDDARHQARRALLVSTRADGSAHLEGEATPELAELLQTVLDTTAAPRPAVDGVQDARTAAQRNHDGLLAALDTAVRCGDLPAHNGVSTTVVVTMTAEQFRTRGGLATTGHGRVVPVVEALGWGGGDSEVLAVALTSAREITHYGHTHRIFSENQRLALTARDGGCTVPGCPEPPSRCQAHHVRDFADGGPTSVGNGALVCRWHHRHLIDAGWHAVMIGGRPWWVPPARLDAQRSPRRNTVHDVHPAA